MKPMTMKKPSECCGSPTLLWDKVKGHFVCPCGQLRVNERGLPIRRLVSFVGGRTKVKLKKSRFDERGKFK